MSHKLLAARGGINRYPVSITFFARGVDAFLAPPIFPLRIFKFGLLIILFTFFLSSNAGFSCASGLSMRTIGGR